MKKVIKKNGAIFSKAYECPATGDTRRDVKGKVRYRIEKEVVDGTEYDLFDLVADLSKRICMVERLVMRTTKAMKDEGTLPAAIATGYGALIDSYVAGVDNGVLKDRADLDDNIELFSRLVTRTTMIANIIEEEMY